MEILNNFASIYCYIAFVIGAVFMFIAVCVTAMGKDDEPRNKVRFYVTCELISFGHIVDKTICQDYNGWNIPNVVYWFPMPKLPNK